jgi:arginase
LRVLRVDQVATSSDQILDWIQAESIAYLAIHLDLDVLDPQVFRSQGFAAAGQVLEGVMAERVGSMTFEQILRIIRDVSAACDVVGLGITEHMPWYAINLRDTLAGIPILAGP